MFASQFLVNRILEIIQQSEPNSLFSNRISRKKRGMYDVNYLTDLGLRRGQEAKNFFIENLRKFDKNQVLDILLSIKVDDHFTMNTKELLKLPAERTNSFSFFVRENVSNPKAISDLMDFYVNILGSWEDADDLAKEVHALMDSFLNDENTAFLFANCGNLYAHKNDLDCLFFYDRSASLWDNEYQKFSVIFRKSVAHVKRLRSSNMITESSFKETYQACHSFGEATGNDLNTKYAIAIVKNLEALFLIKNKNHTKAEYVINQAWDAVKNMDVSTLDIPPSIVNRYRMQIIENVALLSGLQGEWGKAIEIFKEAVELSKKTHTDSLEEALSYLGYSLLYSKKAKEAIPILLECENLYAHSVLTDKLNQIRKMLAVAFDDVGNTKESNRWLQKIK